MFNTMKLYQELIRAGIPIDACNSDGRIDFKPEATQEQIEQAEQIKAAHNPNTPLPEEQAMKDDFAALRPAAIQSAIDKLTDGTITQAELRQVLVAVLKALRHIAEREAS